MAKKNTRQRRVTYDKQVDDFSPSDAYFSLSCARHVAPDKKVLCQQVFAVYSLPCARHGKVFAVCKEVFAVCIRHTTKDWSAVVTALVYTLQSPHRSKPLIGKGPLTVRKPRIFFLKKNTPMPDYSSSSAFRWSTTRSHIPRPVRRVEALCRRLLGYDACATACILFLFV